MAKSPDIRIAALAGRQYGLITRAQARQLGLSPRQIDARQRKGALHRMHRGVYAVGHRRLSSEGRFLAAVLACGPGAVLSHVSAAALWGLVGQAPGRVHVTVPTRNGLRPGSGIALHRCALPARDVSRIRGIPITSPGRTLLDYAGAASRRMFERAFDEAHYLRLDLTGLEPCRGRPGSALVRRVLAEHSAGSTRTRSELEERFLAACDRYGLPRPSAVNVLVEGHLVDLVWAEQRVIVELDGYQAHGTRRAFERDRLRDAELTAAGWRVVRVTWKRLIGDPRGVMRQLGRLIHRM